MSRAFFFDNCISPQLARAFRELGVDVLALVDIWPEARTTSVADVEWMPEVARRERVAITADARIMKRPEERAVRERVKLTTVFLHETFVHAVGWSQVVMLVRTWPAIEAAVERSKPGACFRTTAQHKVESI